ncbi:MAG TPA: hypothetical protein VHO67_10900, partial [Polyangia bacterium]|nr:hypothetical protein [Polyangia bacterium]
TAPSAWRGWRARRPAEAGMRRRRLLALATIAFAAGGCEQTLQLYPSGPDGGVTATGGKGGRGGGGGNVDAGSGSDGHCSGFGPPSVTVTPDFPEIVVALDRSTDMNQPFEDGQSQWQAAAQTLSSYAGSYSAGNHSSHPPILFSFLDFPDSDSGCSQAGCCSSAATLAKGGFSDFANAAYMCPPSSTSCLVSNNKPIGAALVKAQQTLAAATVQSNQRYVLLVTDGQPTGSCAKSFDDCTYADEQASAISNDTGHFPFVIRMGPNASDCLSGVAGIGNAVPFATGYTTLNSALDAVMASTVCSASLSPILSAEEANQLQVTVAFHTMVLQDQQSGWTYDPTNGRLHLHGTACTTYAQNGGLQVTSPCGHSGPGSSPP